MARKILGLGALCLVGACGLEHPISRSLDVNPIEADRVMLDLISDDAADVVDASIPADRTDVVIPVDTPDVVIPVDAPDVVIPVDAPDVVIPVDAPDVVIPVDTPDVVIPMDTPDVVIPVDAPDVVIPVDAPDVVIPMDAPDVVIPMDMPDVVIPVDAPDVVDVPVLPDIVDVIVDSGPPVYDSCEAVRLAGLPSGVYLVRAGETNPSQVYCDTSDPTGAWTLVLKADGRLRTFAFDAPLWTNSTLWNETAVNLERTEAKYIGFVTLSARSVRVQMVSPPDAASSSLRSLVMTNPSGAPLQRVFLDPNYIDRSMEVSESDWFGLVTGSSVQPNCRRRGFNARSNSGTNARVRLGMVGNDNGGSAVCASHESWIGVGGAGSSCGTLDLNTVGNVACDNGTGGARDLRAFAYVWVR